MTEPAVLIVCFQLRLVGLNPMLHAVFRAESIANTPLFAGFPGFVSKLWLTDLRTGFYRGIYQWSGADRATAYATVLTRLLRAVCRAGSIRFHVEPDTLREDFLSPPSAGERVALATNEMLSAVRPSAHAGPMTMPYDAASLSEAHPAGLWWQPQPRMTRRS